ncbi:MAG: hypothetical protein CMH46_07755 [Muricauda sp.]|nr:DUF4138 domain-containing protein [Allomuricauda sp.]MAU15419.1 hypothetical protein [Allomuricauda sp.]|tara:strand:+ start:4577 stop:5383 length:807 start_codon:yes stop_codon:yes gene_type:complete
MKTFRLFTLLFLSLAATYGQGDTLYVNGTHVMALIFPEPVLRAVTGHPNYTFGYSTEAPERLGLVQGNPGPDSNLLVVTRDGSVYSYPLVYRERLGESHRFVDQKEAIGNVFPQKRLDDMGQREQRKPRTVPPSDSLRYQKACRHFLGRRTKALRSKRKDGIVLRLVGVDYYQKETYITLEVENRTAIDLEMDVVQLFKVHGNPGKRSSYQKLPLEPLYRHRMPSKVEVGKAERFVYVVPKFTLGDNERLWVELREKRGSRHMVLRSR